MSNSYTLFSERIEEITPAAAEWIETLLTLDVDTDEAAIKELCYELGLELDADVKDSLVSFPFSFPCFCWKLEGAEKSSLWLYSKEGLIDDHLIWFVQALIRKFMPDYIFKACFACTCSKPLLGEFGGYWIVVAADFVESGSTWNAALEAIERRAPARAKKSTKRKA